LTAHFSLLGNSLEERCAITLMDLPASEIRSWADCVKMPIEVRDFSEIFSELGLLIEKNFNSAYQAADVLTWFNRADVWRKPDRAQAILNLANNIGLNVSPLINAIHKAQAINTAEIIAGVAAEDRSNGERIGSAFESARLAAITAALRT
jgi:tRNA nucleotidyltransferase (CCA-adding enzyme)